jgi:hypothetical protein
MVQDWVTLAAVLALAVSVGLLALLLVARRRPRHRERVAESRRVRVDPAAKQPQHPPGGVPSPPDGVGERLQEVEQQLRLLAERQDQLDLRRPMAQPYRLAIKLAQSGAGIDEIVRTCGINRGEAELVAMLHRARRA